MRLLLLLLVAAALAQPPQPKFNDYPATETWNGTNAPVLLRTASERLFKTNLTNAAKEPPDFAGHFNFAGWGCGSNCAAGAIIDLHTGIVYPPPGKSGNESGWDRWIFTLGIVEGNFVDYRKDSRLVIVRSQRWGIRAYIWENDHFRALNAPPPKPQDGSQRRALQRQNHSPRSPRAS
ncbi:MAG: hypothetical protein EXQ57_10365 [Bryobacterales bacterium]|nr:hypothetical protein [Bryobacterales bacterium]